jgi:hypothetical protein
LRGALLDSLTPGSGESGQLLFQCDHRPLPF